MKEIEDKKTYYFVDESGDPVFFNRKGKNLVLSGDASQIFIVGYLETGNPNHIHKEIERIRNEISDDLYFKGVPSLSKSLKHFHAKDDIPEIREKIFKVIYNLDIKVQAIVARKNADQFNSKFNAKAQKMYEYLVSKLFVNRLHLSSKIDIYFSKMGNIVREKNMSHALEKAKNDFFNKWGKENTSEIRLFIQEPHQIAALQVIDYMLWSIYRVYTRNDMRYFNFVKDKFSLIVDIFDTKKYPQNYYNSKNPLDINKISPLMAR